MNMTNSISRRRRLNKMKRWRRLNSVVYCDGCGEKIKESLHHFYCTSCWNQRKLEREHYFNIMENKVF